MAIVVYQMSNNYQWAKDIPCRNIQTHGFCKFENKGCGFNHDMARDPENESNTELQQSPQQQQQHHQSNASLATEFSAAIKAKSAPLKTTKHNFDLPSFVPTPPNLNKFSALSPSLENIPTFVPTSTSPSTSHVTSIIPPSKSASAELNNNHVLPFNPETALVFTPTSTISMNPQEIINQKPTPLNGFPEDAFFQNTNLYPPNFHLYAPPPPPHIELNKKINELTVDDLFINREFRNELQLKNEESLKSVGNNQLDLPIHVNQYHSLYPLDRQSLQGTSYGYNSMVYKCVSNTDGLLYCMRRLQNVPINSSDVIKKMKIWKNLKCSNVTKLYEVFTTRSFGDNSLILVYDYYPLSYSLLEYHFGTKPELITEDCLWNYTFQLLNAITEANKLNLTLGPFSWSKILVTNKGRIRLSDIGLKSILLNIKEEKDESENISDLNHLGKIIYSLAKVTLPSIPEIDDPSIVINELNYSRKLKDVLLYLFNDDAKIDKFTEMISSEILRLSNGLQDRSDFMESQLSKELENARLVRLFAKLDFISERPEFIKDKSWSDTGDRYPIRLFKDYVFHQYENGLPRIDLTHVIDCLNKLDAGVDEKILLVSPDEMNCMIVSYKSLKEILDRSFQQLVSGKVS